MGRLYLFGVKPNTQTNMTKRTLTAAILSLGAAFVLTTPARADVIVSSLPSYDSPGYDFVSTFPPPGYATIGTFTFSIPASELVTGITISGTFGNSDSPTTALSDYYLGDATDGETAVEVASCDSGSAACEDGQTPWTYTLTPANLSTLASGIGGGSLDFTYTWDTPEFAFSGFDQYVYAGASTLTIQTTPEPTSVLLLFSALAGIVVLRRFRRV